MRTLRELIAQSAARADVDFLVQGEDPSGRLTFGQHDQRARAVASRAGAARRRRRRPRRVVLGEQPRLGGRVLGVRGVGRGRRAVERVVERRGARVRAQRLGREGVDLRSAALGGDRRPAAPGPHRRPRVRHRRRAGRGRRRPCRRASPSARSPSWPRAPRISTRRRSPRTTSSRSCTRRVPPAARRARRSRTGR